MSEQCYVCKHEAVRIVKQADLDEVICERCGTFVVKGTLGRMLRHRNIGRLSGFLREHWERNHEPYVLDTNHTDELLSLVPDLTKVHECSMHLFRMLALKSPTPGLHIDLKNARDEPLAYAENSEQFRYFLQYLEDEGLIQKLNFTSSSASCEISPRGWHVLGSAPNADASKVFVAMWFSDDVEDVYTNGIQLAVEDDCGYTAIRVDRTEFLGDVVDEILANIRESRFIISDMTGHRHGVYFEAGFAMGLGLPVIYTCRKDAMEDAHFDIAHFNHVVWENPEELREKLALRIRATIGSNL